MPVLIEQPTSKEDTPDSAAPITHEAIELRAYFRYTHRGCIEGFALEDWLEAERELQQEMTSDDASRAEA